MTVAWVRENYGVPVKVGGIVRPLNGPSAGEAHVVTKCSNLVHARHLFSPKVKRWHPFDLEYQTEQGWQQFGPAN